MFLRPVWVVAKLNLTYFYLYLELVILSYLLEVFSDTGRRELAVCVNRLTHVLNIRW